VKGDFSDLVPTGPAPKADVLSGEFEKRAGGGILGRLGYSASQVMPSLFKGDAGIRDRALEAVPGSHVETGPEGSEIVVTPEGERFYVNAPGIDKNDVFKFAGQVASFLPAGRLVRGATIPARMLQAGAGAAATDAVGQAASGQGVDVGQVGLAGVFGSGGQLLSDGLVASGKAAAQKITPELRALYEAAKARGIPLTPTQLTDSRFMRYLESQMRALPLSGAASQAADQVAAWNRQVVKALGMKGDRVTPTVYAAAKARDKEGFERLTARNNVDVDDGLLQKLEAIKEEATLAGDNAAKATANAVDAVYSRVRSINGRDVVPGRAYQALDSQMGNVAKLGNEASHYVGKVRDAVRGAMDSSISPADKAEWQQLRQWYGMRKTLTDLVAKANGGDISPAALLSRVTSNKAGKEAMASGTRGELGTLARIGQLMREPGSSGTAERIMAGGLLNPVNWPATAVGLSLGSATRLLPRRAAAAAIVSPRRGQGRQLVAPLVRRAVTPAGTATGASKRKSDD
jgi:hypothetical protein